MSNAKKNDRPLEGYYNYYGIPAYIIKQRNGAYASGFYDPIEGIFKAGGSAKKILWDGMRLTDRQAKKLIRDYSRELPIFDEDGAMPEWILLPEEATTFLDQSDAARGIGGLNETINKQDIPEKKDTMGNGDIAA